MNRLALRDLHILKFARLVVDADFGRRNPARELAQLRLLLHQALNKITVRVRRQKFAAAFFPFRIAWLVARDVGLEAATAVNNSE